MKNALFNVLAPRPQARPSGLSPGTLIAEHDASPTVLRFMRYGSAGFEEKTVEDVDALPAVEVDPEGAAKGVLWLDVVGLAHVEVLRTLGERFALHPLLLEDVVNVNQRPKVETYGDDLFLIARMACVVPSGGASFRAEQVAVVVRPGLVITFQERPGDSFEPVRERIRGKGSRIRHRGADYLAYALLDGIVDDYLPLLDHYGEVLETIEDRMLDDPQESDLRILHGIRRDLIKVRKMALPLREAIHAMLRDTLGVSPFSEETLVFLRDCYDHAVRTLDQVDGHRELAASLMELYMSTVSNRTNDVMKVLTMIATIFIPLSFIAGLYGMNFDTQSPWNMPELEATFGYPMVLGVMALMALLFVWYFWRKGWF